MKTRPNRSLKWGLTSSLILAALTVSAVAWPCSLAPGPQIATFPLDGSIVVDLPLLSARTGVGVVQLTDDQGTEIDISVELDHGLTDTPGDLEFYRPTSALPPGDYFFVDRTFTVDATATSVVPDIGSTGRLELHIDDDSEPACASDSCGDLSRITLAVDDLSLVANATNPVLVAIEITPDGEDPITMLRTVGPYSTSERMILYTVPTVGNPRNRDAYCGRIAPISNDGTVGAFIDLGCDEQPGRGGCHVSPATRSPVRGLAWMGLIALAFVFARRRATRAQRR